MLNTTKTNKRTSKAKSPIKRPKKFSKKYLALFVIIFAAVGGVTIWKSLAATASGIVLNQTAPKYGDHITFTETYPKAAAANYLKPRYPFNPETGVTCWQNGVQVYLQYTTIVDKSAVSNGDGTYTAQSSPIGLSVTGDVTTPWTGGAANCQAIFWYNDKTGAYHILGQLQFSVSG